MLTQVWDHLQNHPKAEEVTSKLSQLFEKWKVEHGLKTAIRGMTNRFWKFTRK